MTSAGPRPRSTSTASSSSFALPTARPSGACIEVSQATARQPMAPASSTRVRASSSALSGGPHERARAHLHVEHQAVQILGELLAQDARRDERDGVHRRGDVAERVEPPVRRSELLGLPEHAHPQLAQDALRLGRARGRCGSRGWRRACPACRRCGRARGRSPSARRRRRRRPAGRDRARPCPPRRRWSACPPSGASPVSDGARCRSGAWPRSRRAARPGRAPGSRRPCTARPSGSRGRRRGRRPTSSDCSASGRGLPHRAWPG